MKRKLKTWYKSYLSYVTNQYHAYKSLSPDKRTKARKKLVLTNFENLIKNFIYKLEKEFAINQLIYLIELFIKDEELISYAKNLLFKPLDQIYDSINEKTEELKLLYERVKMSEIYIKYYTIFQNNSLQIGTVHHDSTTVSIGGKNSMGSLLDELKTRVKLYINNKESKEKIFLSLLRIKQINDSLSNSFNDKVI